MPLSVSQFQEWANRRSNLPLAVKGHTFIMKGDDVFVVDGGKFIYEDALQLAKLLNSNSILDQFNASLMIMERNGTLRLVALGLVAVILIVAILLAVR